VSRWYPSARSWLMSTVTRRYCCRVRRLRFGTIAKFMRRDVVVEGVTNRRRLQMLGTDACSFRSRKRWEIIRGSGVAVMYQLRLR
jgi:hypothetical protein